MLDPKNSNQPGRLAPMAIRVGKPFFAAERDPHTKRALLIQSVFVDENPYNATNPTKYSVWNLENLARGATVGGEGDFGSNHQFVTGTLKFTSMPRTSNKSNTLPGVETQFKSGWSSMDEEGASAPWYSSTPTGKFSYSVSGKNIDIFSTKENFVHWYPIIASKGINLTIEVEPVRWDAPSDTDPQPKVSAKYPDLPPCFWPENSYENTYKRILSGECDGWIDGFAATLVEGLLAYGYYRKRRAAALKAAAAPSNLYPPELPTICVKFGSEMSLPDQAHGISIARYAVDQKGNIIKPSSPESYVDPQEKQGQLLPSMEAKAKGYREAYAYFAGRVRTWFSVKISQLKKVQQLTGYNPTEGFVFQPLKQLKFGWCAQGYSPCLSVKLAANGQVTADRSTGKGQFLNAFIIDKLFPSFNLGPIEEAGMIEYVGFDAYSVFARGVTPRFAECDVDKDAKGFVPCADLRWQYTPYKKAAKSVFSSTGVKFEAIFKQSNEGVAKSFSPTSTPSILPPTQSDFAANELDSLDPDYKYFHPRYRWGGVTDGVRGCLSVHLHDEVGSQCSSWLLPEHCFGPPLYGLVKYFGNTKRYLVGEMNCYVIPKFMLDEQLVGQLFAKLYPTSSKVKEKEYTNRDVLEAQFSAAGFDASNLQPQSTVISDKSWTRVVNTKCVDSYYKYVNEWFSKSFWARRASEYLRIWSEQRNISVSAAWFVSSDKGSFLRSAGETLSGNDAIAKDYPDFSKSVLKAYKDSSLEWTLNSVALFREKESGVDKEYKTRGRSYRFDGAGTSLQFDGKTVAGTQPLESDQKMLKSLLDAIVAGDQYAEALKAEEEKLQGGGVVTGFLTTLANGAQVIKGYRWASIEHVQQAMQHYRLNVPPLGTGTGSLPGSAFRLPPTRATNGYFDE